MSVLAATWSRSEPGNYLETVAELDDPKLKSENVLVCARVRDSTVTLSCVTLVRSPEETAMLARELAGRQGFGASGDEPKANRPQPEDGPSSQRASELADERAKLAGRQGFET